MSAKMAAQSRISLQQEIGRRQKELAAIADRIRDQEIIRGLTRGNLMICLRRIRNDRGWSLDDVAESVGCSKPMLHDLENGRRWSDDIVAKYVTWATGIVADGEY